MRPSRSRGHVLGVSVQKETLKLAISLRCVAVVHTQQKGYLPFGQAVQEVRPVMAQGHRAQRHRPDLQDGQEGYDPVPDRCDAP
jgi:hypothetical protein